MLQDLSYPLGLIAVEKEIATGRRPDILCYRRESADLTCLLIVECKAQKCGVEARKQAFGYNASLGAPFVCVADPFEIHTLFFDGALIASVPFLPSYPELQKMAHVRR